MWHDMMSDNSLHERGFDDQYSFNRLATSEIDAVGALHSKAFPLQRVQTDERVFWAAPNDTMRLMVLPSALFAGVHSVALFADACVLQVLAWHRR